MLILEKHVLEQNNLKITVRYNRPPFLEAFMRVARPCIKLAVVAHKAANGCVNNKGRKSDERVSESLLGKGGELRRDRPQRGGCCCWNRGCGQRCPQASQSSTCSGKGAAGWRGEERRKGKGRADNVGKK